MITCQHAKQLFDRYLDDELSPSFQAELHAHVLTCLECRNELAILEACGDVIRLDKCEPVLGSSFTDRVMAAHRQAKAKAIQPKAWRRIAIYVGSPMAAAASIILAFLIFSPMVSKAPSDQHGTVIQSAMTAAPAGVRKNLTEITGRKPSPEAERELASMPEMPALSFLESLLTPLVEGTRNAVEGTRRSAEDIELLIRYGFDNMQEQLIAEYRQRYPDDATLGPLPRPAGVASDLDALTNPVGTAPKAAAEKPAPAPQQADEQTTGAF